MLMWITQNETSLPDKVRQTILRLFNKGYTFEDQMRSRGRPIPNRCHAVAVIFRNNRYDLYPFNRELAQSFRKMSTYTERNGSVVELDFHTEGFPVFEPDDDMHDWLHMLYGLGLIDAFVMKDREQAYPQEYEEGRDGYRVHSDSKYRLYHIENRTIYPIEWWYKHRNERIPLTEAYYNHDRYRFVRVLDVGNLMPEVRKGMRRYTVSWLRALARQEIEY